MGSGHDPWVAPEETLSVASTLTVISANSPPSILIFTMVLQQGKSQAKIQGAKTLVFSGLLAWLMTNSVPLVTPFGRGWDPSRTHDILRIDFQSLTKSLLGTPLEWM